MNEKPLWLLDVDGVLNALWPELTPPDKRWPRYEKGRANRFTITWAPGLISWINGLVSEDLVEIQWCTTWRKMANAHISPVLGLPEFTVVDDDGDDKPGWWKWEVAKLVTSERPLVWTDDDLVIGETHMPEIGDWVHGRMREHDNLLAIAPKSNEGLLPEHMQLIDDFLRKHQP